VAATVGNQNEVEQTLPNEKSNDVPAGDVPGALTAFIRKRLPAISPQRYRSVLLVALFLVSFIIFTGALVRLSGSGLGCPEWPTCNTGQLLNAPNKHARIELANRYLTGWIAAGVVLLGLTSMLRVPYRRNLVRLSLAMLVGVFGQALLGGLTVILKLKPQAVMGHFLLSIALLTVGLVLHNQAGVDLDETPIPAVSDSAKKLSTLMVVATTSTVFLGTVVTSSGPHGGDDIAERFAYSMRSVVRLHSASAWVLMASAVGLAWVLRSTMQLSSHKEIHRRLRIVFVAIVVQGAVGYVQYFNRVPAPLVAVHILGVIAIWCSVLRLAFVIRSDRGAHVVN
jgi:heme a synthase